MHNIGFSTGAIALGDYIHALAILNELDVDAVELSALRLNELQPLVYGTRTLDLHRYKHIAFHAPSRYESRDEESVVNHLTEIMDRGWSIILHPDALIDFSLWKPLERNLCFENMDRRKPIGRTANELSKIFDFFPSAGLCFDVGHAHQIDRTMTEARLILQRFGSRVRQIHVSEVNTASEHVRVSIALKFAIERISDLISDDTPLIIESVLPQNRLRQEIRSVARAFDQTMTTIGVTD